MPKVVSGAVNDDEVALGRSVRQSSLMIIDVFNQFEHLGIDTGHAPDAAPFLAEHRDSWNSFGDPSTAVARC